MIQALFGLPDIALRTMEVYTTGTLESWLLPPPPPQAEWRECMERLSADACELYRGYVYEHPAFLDYFRTSTPAPELEELNIGSRPARRGGSDGGVRRCARFRGSSRGRRRACCSARGSASRRRSRARSSAARRTRVRAMYRDWTHFRSAVDLFEMVLAKADARIAAEYDGSSCRRRCCRAIRTR